MTAFLIVLAVAAEAYLLGSVDTGILVSKYLYHDDVRTHGSGAAGMTNMLRTFGKKAAALTAVGDVLKGVVAVCLGRWLFGHLPADAAVSPYLGVYLAAILAVVGHSKPIYFGFKGGKGVLVAAGAILAVQPVLLPVLALIFLVCLVPTGMVSLGSITMAAAYPVLTLVYSLMRGLPTGTWWSAPSALPSWAAWSSGCTVPTSSASGTARSTGSARSTRATKHKRCPAGSSRRASCGAFCCLAELFRVGLQEGIGVVLIRGVFDGNGLFPFSRLTAEVFAQPGGKFIFRDAALGRGEVGCGVAVGQMSAEGRDEEELPHDEDEAMAPTLSRFSRADS